ncbi:MAG: hypothetical protein ABIU58_09705 [Ramlibacter sp.]
MTPSKLAQVKSRPPVAPPTSNAWLDQMAADAGHVHLRRLVELKKELEAEALPPEFSAIHADLSQLAEALPGIDFGLLHERGWWARTSGKTQSAGARFAEQFRQVEQITDGLAEPLKRLNSKQQAQAQAMESIRIEIKGECKAIDQIIDQGARWLQDMRDQLKLRVAAATDAKSEEAIKDDTARCEILVDRLKALRATLTAAQQSRQQLKATAAKRDAVMQFLLEAVSTDLQTWQNRLSTLAEAAPREGLKAEQVDGAMETHREFQLCVKRAVADCTVLSHQEKTLMESLAALDAQA